MSTDNGPIIKVGQLWRWAFTVLKDGAWMLQRVSSEARHSMGTVSPVFIHRGDVFTVVTVDDPGPALFYGSYQHSRYHVVLLGGALVWMKHSDFDAAELLQDVE